VEAIFCLLSPFTGSSHPPAFGILGRFFPPNYGPSNYSFLHAVALFISGIILLFIAPWTTRLVVWIDRQMMQLLLGPDALTTRVRTLERSRAQTVDASAATLRRIERDLHDGTQAQLVALAMRLGQAKEKLSEGDDVDLVQIRQLVDEAHAGAKEAMTELRDLARGIHPPVLDIGLEGALSTLAARSAVPSTLSVVMSDRPTPAIEAIAYFCVAELLAYVAKHSRASGASVSCAQHGAWLRVVVRDNGQGGAHLSEPGSMSSGLTGLADRVQAVDGRFYINSPFGGPSEITVDLPLHA